MTYKIIGDSCLDLTEELKKLSSKSCLVDARQLF